MLILAAILACLSVLLFVLALRTLQAAKSGIYYSIRKNAQIIGQRLLIGAFGTAIMAGVMTASRQFAPVSYTHL
ncbi:MAG: hypothetical protein KIH69_007465, partial [Anaerolineae bacterium]|nr:hypothetical protein [Anaerolineae bacterium]